MPAATAKVIKFFAEKDSVGAMKPGQIGKIKREWDELSEQSQEQLLQGISDDTLTY